MLFFYLQLPVAPPPSKLKQRIERDTLNKKKIEKDKYSKSSTRTSASEATGPAAAAAALDHPAAGSNNSVAFLRAKSNLEVTHSLTLFQSNVILPSTANPVTDFERARVTTNTDSGAEIAV
jgi:hypothetical protein